MKQGDKGGTTRICACLGQGCCSGTTGGAGGGGEGGEEEGEGEAEGEAEGGGREVGGEGEMNRAGALRRAARAAAAARPRHAEFATEGAAAGGQIVQQPPSGAPPVEGNGQDQGGPNQLHRRFSTLPWTNPVTLQSINPKV